MSQSSFTALNLSDDELDIEEHTRELQIEIALNTLNKALEFQKNNQFDKAHLKYDELGRIEILQQPNVSNNPTINRLKYLYCRNRGMLRLRELIDLYKLKQQKMKDRLRKEKNIKTESDHEKAGGNTEIANNFGPADLTAVELESSDRETTGDDDDDLEISVYGEIIGSINDLLNATVYGIPDVKIVQILSSLFNHFGHPRLARLCYEMKLNTTEDSKVGDDLRIDLNRPDELLFNQVNLLENFLNLLDEISDNTSSLYKKVERCLQSKRFWDEIRRDGKHSKYNWNDILTIEQWNTERMREPDNLILGITVVDELVDLNSFLEEIINCVPKPKGKSRLHDGYYLTKSIFAKVEFDFDVGITQVEEHLETAAEEIDIATTTNFEAENDSVNLEEASKTEGKEPIASKPKNVIASRATRSARSKPDADPTNDHAKTKLKSYDVFVSQTLPSFLKLCGIDAVFQPLSKLVFSDNVSDISDIDKNIFLFYSCVASWNDEYTQCLTVTDEKRDRAQLKSTSTSDSESESIREIVNLKSAKVINPHLYERKKMSEMYQFLRDLSQKNMHFNQIRTAIVKFMFASDPSSGTSIFCVEPMTKKAIKNFKILVDCVSMSLYNEFEHFILYKLELHTNRDVSFSEFNTAVSIFETLVDSYVEFIQDQKLKKASTYKQTLTNLQNFENTIIKRIEKWRDLIEDAFAVLDYRTAPELSHIWSRFVWFKLYYLQSHSQALNPQELTDILSELSNVVQERQIYLPFVNFELIPVLNYENIQTQSSKLKILDIFDKNEESNKILESVLLNKMLEPKDNSTENQKIQVQFENFINNSNLPLKLRLWSLLLRYYRLNSDILSYKNAFEHIIEIMMNQLKPKNTEKLSDHDSKMLILNVIGFFCHFSRKFINFCNTTRFECFNNADRESSLKMVRSISHILYMLYSFLMYQNAVQIDARLSLSVKSSKAFEILSNCVSCCFFLLSFYYPTALASSKPEYIGDFLSVCHIELGLLHMCSALDGAFLKYAQCKLTNLNFSISANDVFQIIHCRFGLSISLDGFETFDHKCKPRRMTLDDTIQLSKFVSTYCFKGKHPVTSPPRNDIKNIIDKIVDVVGNPDPTNDTVLLNKKLLDSYLSRTSISLQFVIDSFHGKSELNFEKPNIPGIEVAENGLYYIEGLIGLHFFKVRRRTMQSRAAELDYVLKMLENDILCGCNRFESWVALGQTYSLLVEDDLIWTADKLNSVERKQMTALTQKKALLCYLMAVRLHFKSSEEEKVRHGPVIPILWESFAKELYAAWMEPMNRKAFHVFVDDESSNVKANSNESSSSKVANITAQSNDIPNNAIFKLLELAFKSAVEGDGSNWYDIMYLAKSQCKLRHQNSEPKKIIGNLLQACDIAMKQSSKDDPIIEPHYYLFSIISKFYLSSKISLSEAYMYLRKDSLFSPLLAFDLPKETFESLTYKILNKIIAYDKKNWQHRPIYRLARFYYDMDHDIDKAKKELLSLINLKPNIRSLSTIWKPTSERPGKHFIYNSVYTQFLVQLLYEKGDIYSLTILLKKMRRAGSIMVNLTKTFDNMMLRICILIKKSLNLLPGFLDDSISKLRFSDFTKYSAEFVEHLEHVPMDHFDEEMKLHLYFLSEAQTFRKLATGFGATGLIDECYHSIYIKLFMPFLFDRIIAEKNGGVLNKKLLTAAKEFTTERLVRSKQSALDVTTKLYKSGSESESTELKSATPMADILNDSAHPALLGTMVSEQQSEQTKTILAQTEDNSQDELSQISAFDLSTKERYSIINYLSFGKSAGTGTPSKEKIKVARRDVSPFALKIVNATQALVNSIKENTNDGETIDYKISGPLDNTEFEKAIVGVMVKETKENKEEKEFEELISAHDRFFTESELIDFNRILQNLGVSPLCDIQTNVEMEIPEIDRGEKPKVETTEVEPQKFPSELNRDIYLSEASADATRTATPVPINSEERKKNILDNKITQADEYNPFTSPTKNVSAGEPLTVVRDDSPIVEHEIGSVAKNLSHSMSVLRSRSTSAEENRPLTTDTSDSTKQILVRKSEKTPSRSTQSTITSFFKVSPNKASLSPPETHNTPSSKRKIEDEQDSNAKDEFKRARLVENEPQRSFFQREGSDDLSRLKSLEQIHSPSRRHSRRGSSRSMLLELGESGGVTQQVDIKQRREHALLENAESLSSSTSPSDSEQSIIVID